MRKNIRKKLYKILSDAGLSSMSIGTFGMVSSMMMNNDPLMAGLSTGFLTGGLVCNIASKVLLLKAEYNAIENEESIWNNSKLYYLAIEQNRLKRVEAYIFYKKTRLTFKQKECILKDLYMERLILNKKIEIMNNNKISIEDKLDYISKLEEKFIPSDIYNMIKEDLLKDAEVVNLNPSNISKERNNKEAKILNFPKLKR